MYSVVFGTTLVVLRMSHFETRLSDMVVMP